MKARPCQTCDPEVDDLQRAASIDDQVRRLNIPVHHSCPTSGDPPEVRGAPPAHLVSGLCAPALEHR
jgi:hypothetical protein